MIKLIRAFRKFTVALAFVALPTLASASTLTFYNDASTLSTERFTLGCTLTCQASLWDGAGTFSSTIGDLTSFGSSGIATEIAGVNAELGSSFATATQTSMGGATSTTFSSVAQYFLIKIGKTPNYALIWNTGGAGNSFTFNQTGLGAGLSHITEFGSSVPQVPLPAGGLLLIGALGGLGLMRKRRKA